MKAGFWSKARRMGKFTLGLGNGRSLGCKREKVVMGSIRFGPGRL